MKTHRGLVPVKTPIHARSLRLLFAGVLFALARTSAAQPAPAGAVRSELSQRSELNERSQRSEPRQLGELSERDVIRLARLHSPASALSGATERLAQARTRTAGPLPNPSLHWSREAIATGPVGAQGAEDTVTATFPIEVARPLASRSLVAAEGAWVRAEAALARTDAVLQALWVYYDVVLARQQTALLVQSVADLDEAARVLARREAAGSASGYESARLAIAAELARSRLAEAQAAEERGKVQLAALLGVAPQALHTPAALSLLSAANETPWETLGTHRVAVSHARESQRLAGEAKRRAEWAWLPTFEAGVGFKRMSPSAASDGYGYVVGIGLSVPLFDRGQGIQAETGARQALSMARSDALLRTIRADIADARVAFHRARLELDRFESSTAQHVEVLLAAAQSGYREGERSMVELLDAQRALLDVRERHLALLGLAKRAEARLRAAAGELE